MAAVPPNRRRVSVVGGEVCTSLLYMPHELFTKLPTNGVLRTSQARSPPKFAYIGFSEVRIAPVRSRDTRPGQNSLDNAPPLTYPYRVSDHNNPDLRSRNDMDAVRDIARELADIAH